MNLFTIRERNEQSSNDALRMSSEIEIVYKRRLQLKKFQSIISCIIPQHNSTNRLTDLSSSFYVSFHFLNDEKNKWPVNQVERDGIIKK